MFETFFHFSKRPFAVQPDPASIFPAPAVEESLRTICAALRCGEGIVSVCGDPGSGKTLLLERLSRKARTGERFIFLSGGHLTNAKELLRALARALSLPVPGLDEGELRFLVEGALEHGENSTGEPGEPRRIFVLIDEAQNASVEALEELRRLSDRNVGGEAPLRVLLAGTTAMEELLALPALEPFNQRIVCHEYLEPLTQRECNDYIDWHIAAVTTRSAGAQFTDGAKRRVFEHSNGIPRLINRLCETTLQLAVENGQLRIDASTVDLAWNRSQRFRTRPEQNQREECVSSENPSDEMSGANGMAADWEACGNCMELVVGDPAGFDDGDELASFDIDCTQSDGNIQPDSSISKIAESKRNAENKEIAATEENGQDDFSEVIPPLEAKVPAYVYDTNTPVIIQYPCYIDKNIAMLNWVAPGHRVTSGTGTAYRDVATVPVDGGFIANRPASEWRGTRQPVVVSMDAVDAQTLPVLQSLQPANSECIAHPLLAMQFTQTTHSSQTSLIPSIMPVPITSIDPVYVPAALSASLATETVSVVLPQQSASTSRTAIDEHFDDSVAVDGEPIPLIAAFSLSGVLNRNSGEGGPESCVKPSVAPHDSYMESPVLAAQPDEPLHERSKDTASGNSAVLTVHQRAMRQVVSAAERIEQAVERFERTGGKVDTTLEAIGTQIESLSEFRDRPTCRELFERISELHETVARELAVLESRHATEAAAPESARRTAPAESGTVLPVAAASVVRFSAGTGSVSLPDGTCRRFDPGASV
ncbi:MAG TPA: hypothetical protein DEB39_09815, partial [Planctomycetaceae bacterium]|nr:hypothetical protein [Planctomycetaceae bacterium]